MKILLQTYKNQGLSEKGLKVETPVVLKMS